MTARGGRVILTDVEWDPSASRYAIEIVVPVPMPGSDALAGILKVVADSREMLAMVGGVQLGATGEALLLRDNGSIVLAGSHGSGRAVLRQRGAARTRLIASQGCAAARLVLPGGSRRWRTGAVAIAPSQLASSYPNVRG